MRAVTTSGAGDVDVLGWAEVPDPVAGAGELLVDVAASAVNRADLLQRQGFYPPPAGASEILGLECSGTVTAVGAGVSGWSVGDEVCALLAGGGYAEQVAVPVGQCMPVPDGVDLVSAAGLPEVACTVWSNVVQIAGLSDGESFLVHGGSSGIGTMAIQVARALGAATVICTVGSDVKAERCRQLGADVVVNYKDDDFVAASREATGGRGVDVVLDIVGAAYLARNVDVLAADGRLVVIGLQGGAKAELDLGLLLRTRATVHATSLRARPLEQKAALCKDVVERLWPLVTSGRVQPVVHATYPMDRVADAHRAVAASEHVGKVLLTRP
ncbi:MAG TPA: NAD(P)H-quinone oxidoreductase [Mycobacteriales bacterium]|jgi:putative PIG3 family NAD(P)H quinone oxidoreductase|nr:NAD(P)H-quinone oxidoreductase [Mycobacteriales bacterium]